MTAIKVKKPKTFTEFVSIIQSEQANCANSLWYRGCGNSSHSLIPGLYRHKKIKKIAELAKLELQLITRFRQRSVPFHNRDLSSDWELLFFMQHYRIPTRLLDWSESPFVGLYFAVMTGKFSAGNSGRLNFENDAVVWVLDPVAWNRHALNHQSFTGEVLDSSDEAIKGYRPAPLFTDMNNYPVAMYGTHNSPRIVAQRGVFTIFGQNINPMEHLYKSGNFPSKCLLKIVLNKSVLSQFRKSVLDHGITESVIFPDLEGFSGEIRRGFGFEV